MSIARTAISGLLVVALLGGAGLAYVKQQNQERIRDYATVMTNTHGRVMNIYKETRLSTDGWVEAIMDGTARPDEMARGRSMFQKVADETRAEKEKLARVIPPAEAESLQKDGLDFLEARAQLADLGVALMNEGEKKARGQSYSEDVIESLMQKMAFKAGEINGRANSLREKKDEMVLQ